LFPRPSRSYVYLDSRYREQRVVTGYRVVYERASEGGSIERLEAPAERSTASGARAKR
jgi:hypothetical protein